ncbi:hypothetical protein GWI33_021045 [Rhynchophorus ferrugineus]|uniref:Uncharacterized protein n=1 Tax=Rhynchophorus ferrugineus TaxID=354439 RepID=A0A834HNH7_RHYFE|nr:hypothetical protein GWI33_021045 [Rhynchophorus ferrugineus]
MSFYIVTFITLCLLINKQVDGSCYLSKLYKPCGPPAPPPQKCPLPLPYPPLKPSPAPCPATTPSPPVPFPYCPYCQKFCPAQNPMMPCPTCQKPLPHPHPHPHHPHIPSPFCPCAACQKPPAPTTTAPPCAVQPPTPSCPAPAAPQVLTLSPAVLQQLFGHLVPPSPCGCQ